MFPTPLPNTIEIADHLADDSRELADTINERVATLADDRQSIEDKLAAITDPTAGDDDVDIAPDQLSGAIVRSLRVELGIRDDLATFYGMRRRDAQTAATAAHREAVNVRAELVEALHELGFTGDGERYDSRAEGSIYPAMLTSHARVRAARGRHDELAAFADNRAGDALNAKLAGRVREKLNEIRASVGAGVAV